MNEITPAPVPPPRSAQRQIWKFLSGLLTGKAAAGIISLGYLVIAARMLGVTEYGVLNLVHGYAVMIGGVIAFSGWHGLVRYGHDALLAGDHGRFRQLVRFMTLFEIGFFLLAVLIAVILVPFIGPRLGWPPAAMQLAPLYTLSIIATVRTTPNGILQIAERFDLIGWHQIVMPVTRLFGAVLAWLNGWGLTGFIWVWLASAVAEGLSMWIMGLWQFRKMNLAHASRATLREVNRANPGFMRFILTTNADITLREFAPRAIPLVIGWILGPAATGLYSLAQRASVILQQPAQMLGHASYAVAARLAAEGKSEESRTAIWKSVGLATLAALPVALVISLFARQLLELLGGKGFEAAVLLLILIVVGRALIVGGPTFSSALTALGKPGQSIAVNLFTNIGLLPLLPLFLNWFGIEGAGYHLMLQSVLALILLGWLVRVAQNESLQRSAAGALDIDEPRRS